MRCTTCKVEKPADQFELKRSGSLYKACAGCRAANLEYSQRLEVRERNRKRQVQYRQKRQEDPALLAEFKRREANSQLLRYYGITLEQYDKLYKDQGGVCAICKSRDHHYRNNRLHVDHDHESGAIRGLLCRRCNQAIGAFGDSYQLLKDAAAYLLKGKQK